MVACSNSSTSNAKILRFGHIRSLTVMSLSLNPCEILIMNSGSLSERLLQWCDALVGRFRGGLAQVNVLQSIVFAGMSGSAVADGLETPRLAA